MGSTSKSGLWNRQSIGIPSLYRFLTWWRKLNGEQWAAQLNQAKMFQRFHFRLNV